MTPQAFGYAEMPAQPEKVFWAMKEKQAKEKK